jgi:hypothetical protein
VVEARSAEVEVEEAEAEDWTAAEVDADCAAAAVVDCAVDEEDVVCAAEVEDVD